MHLKKKISNTNVFGGNSNFHPQIPFGFIDKLIVKYLHFPGMTMHESTWTNDFYLYSEEDGNYNHKFLSSIDSIVKQR